MRSLLDSFRRKAKAQMSMNPIFIFLFITGVLVMMVWLLSWNIDNSPYVEEALQKQSPSNAGSILSYFASVDQDGSSCTTEILSKTEPRQSGRKRVSLGPLPLVKLYTPAFLVPCREVPSNSTLLEIIGSIHYYHPNSHIVVLTMLDSMDEWLVDKIHSIGHVHHLTSRMIADVYQSLSVDVHPLVAAFITADKYANVIVLPENHYLTSSVSDINREITVMSIMSRTSGLTPGMYLFGFSRDSSLFVGIKNMLESCQTFCGSEYTEKLKSTWATLIENGRQTLIMPLAKVDPKREFYSKKLKTLRPSRKAESTLELYKEEPIIKISALPKQAASKKPEKIVLKPKEKSFERKIAYSKSFEHKQFSRKQLSSKTILTSENGKLVVGMLVPSTSKGSSSIQKLPIFDALLQSMKDTISHEEMKLFDFVIYLGFDGGDLLYDNANVMKKFLGEIERKITGFPISLKAYKMKNFKGAPCWIWNELFRIAYQDGVDYFFQINDDVVLYDIGWASNFVLALQTNPIKSNLGVVGPIDSGNSKTMTQSFVHRTHYEIFKALYPPKFRNWYSDDWMTHVYGKSSTFASEEFFIRNLNNRGQRYREDNSHRSLVLPELKNGCNLIKEYLGNRSRISTDYTCGNEKMYWENARNAKKQRKRRRR